jgi:aminoglycoside phosphotransferase (APT) family kinase protein
MASVSPAADDAEFGRRLARWFAARNDADVIVDEVEHPSVGYSSVTRMVRAQCERDGRVTHARLAVRMPPDPAGTFEDYDLVVQHAAQLAAADAGVPIAAPLQTETDPTWLGMPFTVMPRVDGRIIGEAPPFDDWLVGLGPAAQAELHEHLLHALVAIHGADVDQAIAGGVPVRDDAAELGYWEHYLQWSSDGDPVPELVNALAWCRTHAPRRSDAPRVLRWGDVRLGNIVFGDDLRPRAILDWDMAAIGAPEHDIAWFTMLDFVIATVTGQRVKGFPDRSALIARYEQLAGRSLMHFDWYETFALVRSTAILARIGYLMRADGKQPTMPVEGSRLLDILRERTGAS